MTPPDDNLRLFTSRAVFRLKTDRCQAEGALRKMGVHLSLNFGSIILRDPPVPIPNTEVKPRRADGTARAKCVGALRQAQDKTPVVAGINKRLPTEMLVAFSFCA